MIRLLVCLLFTLLFLVRGWLAGRRAVTGTTISRCVRCVTNAVRTGTLPPSAPTWKLVTCLTTLQLWPSQCSCHCGVCEGLEAICGGLEAIYMWWFGGYACALKSIYQGLFTLSTQWRHWPMEEHLCLTQWICVSLNRGSRAQLPQQQQRTWRRTLILKLCYTP